MDKILGRIALFLGVILYFAFAQGFLFYKFWYWFVVDVFPNLPNISYFQAVGLKLFTGILIMNSKRPIKEEFYKDDKIIWTVTLFLLPWLMVGTGWIIHLFIN